MKKSIVRSVRIEETAYAKLLEEVSKSGKNFNEYMISLVEFAILPEKKIPVIREVCNKKHCTECIKDVVQSTIVGKEGKDTFSGKKYVLNKELQLRVRREDGLLVGTSDFSSGEEVWVRKV